MKKLLLLLALTLLGGLGAAAQGQKTKISGRLEMQSDTVLIYFIQTTDTLRTSSRRFQVAAPGGVFTLEAELHGVANIVIEPCIRYEQKVQFYMAEGEHIAVEGPLACPRFSGVPQAEMLTALFSARNAAAGESTQRQQTALKNFVEAGRNVTQEIVNDYRRYAAERQERVEKFEMEYFRAHANEEVAAFLLSLHYDEYPALFSLLGDEVKSGRMQTYLATWRGMWKRYEARKQKERERAALSDSGRVAPVFALENERGETVHLEDFRGRYVVLDFWGSWCVWCIRGFPEMKKSYEKLKDRVEFIGIDCNDTPEAWKAALKKHALPWVNVREPGEATPEQYGVRGYPSKCIISPEGKIVKMFVGEDPEFYKFLEALLQK